ncbi:hypothetical protein [Natrinema sp. H-ect4]|uniref:hypothetical protein n=1 Tax=Natrinema sp. H-ect4 TaxID=3242699 RepID=UPI0035A867AA
MEDTIATASRNLLAIKWRAASHFVFRKAKGLFPEAGEGISSVLLYPAFEDPEQFVDVLNRLAWYLPPDSFEDFEVHALAATSSLSTSNMETPDAQSDYGPERLPVTVHELTAVDTLAEETDQIIVWDKTHRIDRTTLRRLGKVEIIDPAYYSLAESETWKQMTNQIRTQVQDSSAENFRALERQAQDTSTSYVFGTGPSLDNVFDFNIPSDALSIICNSIVRNENLLDHLQPDILVFADPVFHFGPSKYAHEFRDDAAAVLERYNCTAVIPKQYQSLFVGHYPELSDQIIGLDPVSAQSPVYPSHNRLEVMGTHNIMTLFMLPIAMSLTEDIRIVGADGRKEDESYFWEHSDTAQYDDELMKTVAETHPSFFRDRVYEDYYDQHVETLTEMIKYGEVDGKHFRNLTNSYIPCLDERKVDPTSFH